MTLNFSKTSLPLWVDEGIAGRIPELRLLTLYGALERGILDHFPTTTELRICDLYPTITSLRDTFDPPHDGSSTQMPYLKTVLVQEKFKEPVQNFFADRRLLGLIVPEVRVINML
ncbi:hypothetical protein FIBSPDRAFT_857813 [Athelia psychrophila]|uniref:Uncharacterized protein n=1 Tax=Athelia psychrophila TaxID=1759441 RepID=A0A166MHV3_9AGAM|nr:hypothetical protein FIBSPDRAFT_857808 [Fibularhizoctonia sp. CBS 109695]KZP24023.1 hypothetical protein FIBSPDRAFT_857813 [Fibularhizoctonia sp. CBS 109695]